MNSIALPAAAAPQKSAPTSARLLTLFTVVLVAWGVNFPTERYISPSSGVGYAFGIAGLTAMLLLLAYPLRKANPGLHFIGSTRLWFRIHMVLGIVGPVLIVFHSNFRLGATNSNVAMLTMLVVSGSGVFGRYFYNQLHSGIHDHRATLSELQVQAENLREQSNHGIRLRELADRITLEEKALKQRCARVPFLLRPVAVAWLARAADRRLHGHLATELEMASHRSVPIGLKHEAAISERYIEQRLKATGRVIGFEAFERMFSAWHALHMPLFVLMLLSVVVHVFAVHAY